MYAAIPDMSTKPQRGKGVHPWPEPWSVLSVVIVVLVILIPLGLIWAMWQKPWLINDYRDGYHHGSLSQDSFRSNCDKSAQRHYPQAFNSDEVPSLWNPEVRAFTIGCQDAATGRSNAWWHLDSRLSRNSNDNSDYNSD